MLVGGREGGRVGPKRCEKQSTVWFLGWLWLAVRLYVLLQLSFL